MRRNNTRKTPGEIDEFGADMLDRPRVGAGNGTKLSFAKVADIRPTSCRRSSSALQRGDVVSLLIIATHTGPWGPNTVC